MKKKPKIIWFRNIDGEQIGFPETAKLKDLIKAGVRSFTIAPNGTKPTKPRFINQK